MNFPTWDRPARDAHRELRRMEHEFNGIGGLMRTDVKEDKEGYEVHIDLPGFKKEDVQITLKDGYMTVAASRVNEVEEGKKYLRRERYVGEWLPEPVPADLFAGTAGGGLDRSVADPADVVVLDDEVSTALLVVMEAMTPAERVAFVSTTFPEATMRESSFEAVRNRYTLSARMP